MIGLLSILRSATPERHNKAVQGLRDGSLTVNITYRTDAQIRALVYNGDSVHYGVTFTEHDHFCSCKDALFRGSICKHQLAVCISCLQQAEPTEDRIHLMWDSGEILCGEKNPRRFWQRWTLNALNWSDLVCQACVHAWTHPEGKES